MVQLLATVEISFLVEIRVTIAKSINRFHEFLSNNSHDIYHYIATRFLCIVSYHISQVSTTEKIWWQVGVYIETIVSSHNHIDSNSYGTLYSEYLIKTNLIEARKPLKTPLTTCVGFSLMKDISKTNI